jgi:hypothetical protein
MTLDLEKYIVNLLDPIDHDTPVAWILAKILKYGYLDLDDLRTLKNQDTIKFSPPYWLELCQICAANHEYCLSSDSSVCDFCVIRDECTSTIGSEV